MKMCSTSIVIKDMQMKTARQYQYTYQNGQNKKRWEILSVNEDMEQSETCWWECKLVNYLAISINIKICTPLTKYSILFSIPNRNGFTCSPKHICGMFTAALFVIDPNKIAE